MNHPETTPHPSVAEHPSESFFGCAQIDGLAAVTLIRNAVEWADFGDTFARLAMERAVSAAGYYHEGLRVVGECPECGYVKTDPCGYAVYNDSVGCCEEPRVIAFEDAMVRRYPVTQER